MYFIARLLQATGIASLMIGLILGLQGDMAVQYYYFFGGISIFLIGYMFQKKIEKKGRRIKNKV